MNAIAKHVLGLGHERAPMPLMPFGSPVFCQVRPPLALDTTTAPPVSPTTVRPARRRTGASPDIQHSDALGHARPMNSSAAGNPWAWTDDQGSPPLPETRRTAPAEPPRFDTAMQVSELLHESEARPPTGTGGALAGDNSRPLSVL